MMLPACERNGVHAHFRQNSNCRKLKAKRVSGHMDKVYDRLEGQRRDCGGPVHILISQKWFSVRPRANLARYRVTRSRPPSSILLSDLFELSTSTRLHARHTNSQRERKLLVQARLPCLKNRARSSQLLSRSRHPALSPAKTRNLFSVSSKNDPLERCCRTSTVLPRPILDLSLQPFQARRSWCKDLPLRSVKV